MGVKKENTLRSILIVAALAVVMSAVSQAQAPVYKVGEGVTSPVLVKEVKPDYTPEAKAERVQGTVELRGIVETDGSIGSLTVTRSLDDGLDRQAIKAVEKWQFKPGRKDGEAVRVQVDIELTFTLR